MTDEEKHILVSRLAEPFPWHEVKFKPQAINWRAKPLTAQAAAYADNRAYYERMDSVLGPSGWQVEFQNPVIGEYEKLLRGKNGSEERTIRGFKVMVVSQVRLLDWGVRSSTGSADMSDENDITTAEAQAFKRACAAWGIGRYFYKLGTMEYPYDKDKRIFTIQPRLPDGAIPKVDCEACGQEITAYEYEAGDSIKSVSKSYVLYTGFSRYEQELCGACQRKLADADKLAGGKFK